MTINRTLDGPAPVLRRPILHLTDGSTRSHGLASDPLKGHRPRRFVKGTGFMSRPTVAVDLT